MPLEDFFSKESKARAKRAVEAVERQTAGEIVLVVRTRAAEHRAPELAGALAGGFLGALSVLARPGALAGVPLRFALGAVACGALVRWLAPLKRALVSNEDRSRAVASAARAAFVDLGVTRTRGRTGVLVFVAALERRCEIVCDLAVPSDAVEGPRRAMQAALDRFDFDAFLAALESLGAPLGSALPRGADDVNELPDEVIS